MVMHIPINTFLDNEPYHKENLQDRDAFFPYSRGARYGQFAPVIHIRPSIIISMPPTAWKALRPPSSCADSAIRLVVERTLHDHRGVACADSRDGTPNGFHILSVDGLTYTTRFIPAKEPNGRQVRLSIDSRFHGISKDAQSGFRQVRLLGSPVPREALERFRPDAARADGGEKTKIKMIHQHESGANRDDPPLPARSVRPRSVCPQRGDEKGLGQGRGFVAHLDCAPARRPSARNLSGGGRGDRGIWATAERTPRA